MSKTISISDLKLIPELQHFKEPDFIKPENDKVIAPFLHELGIDLKRPVYIYASQHRNLQGKVVVGFVISGEVRKDREFLKSPFASVEDRLIVAGYKDISLAAEMAKSLTVGQRYGDDGQENLHPDQCNSNESAIMAQIAALQSIIAVVRGPIRYNKDGSQKLYGEYCQEDTVK